MPCWFSSFMNGGSAIFRNHKDSALLAQNGACSGRLMRLFSPPKPHLNFCIKMPFTHSPMPAHPSLVVSYCKKCKSFVAASPRPKVLKSAEKAHMCDHARAPLRLRKGRKAAK
jgi:hypothetical protein